MNISTICTWRLQGTLYVAHIVVDDSNPEEGSADVGSFRADDSHLVHDSKPSTTLSSAQTDRWIVVSANGSTHLVCIAWSLSRLAQIEESSCPEPGSSGNSN